MKRRFPALVLVLALALILVPGLFAGGDPMFSFDPAKVGFIMPEDSEVTIDEGVWYGVSQSARLMVFIAETSEYTEPNEMSETLLSDSLGGMEIRDFEYIGLYGEAVVYVFGHGMTTDGVGADWEGYFGVLKNEEAPEKTYVMAIVTLAPATEESVAAADLVVESLTSLASY